MEADSAHLVLGTLGIAVAAGTLLTAAARRLLVPSIVLLLAGGIALGPEGLDLVHPEAFGGGFRLLVGLSVALILFEGGLSLEPRQYRRARAAIGRLLSVGVAVTWLGTATVVMLIFGLPPSTALLAGSLVIVTGPTVITPLLKRIRLKEELDGLLLWEAVLIDPVGVFVALLCFEWLAVGGASALLSFFLRFFVGTLAGVAGGGIIYAIMRSRFIPSDMIRVASFAFTLLLFGVTESFGQQHGFSEAGLLSVVAAGFVLGALKPPHLKEVKEFFEEMGALLVGLLFILLAARLRFAPFALIAGELLLAVGLLVLVVRPLNVFLSTRDLPLSFKDRIFLASFAPRGIVAASLASLFSIELAHRIPVAEAHFLELFTYAVIIVTVLLHGSTAGLFARLLGLRRAKPRGWVIVGAHRFGREVARFLTDQGGVTVLLIDVNADNVYAANREGLCALVADAREPGLLDRVEFTGTGYLLTLTDNVALNELIAAKWAEELGRRSVRYWRPAEGAVGEPADRDAAGFPVWPDLPAPSVLSVELQEGRALLSQGTEAPLPGELVAHTLLCVSKSGVRFDAGEGEKTSHRLLLYRRLTA